MILRRCVAFLALAAASASVAQPVAPAPKLLIVISVDQFSADLFDEYRGQFAGGFDRLASGTAFRNAFHGQAATETCPGHSVMMTGDRPARTRIIANNWVDQSIERADKKVYCAEDERAPGTDSLHYKVSDLHLAVPTLGDLLKTVSPASRNVAVSGKDRAAVMMSGHNADQRWYWNGKTFVTDRVGAAEPATVTAANAEFARQVATAQPALDPPPFCAGKAQPITLPGGMVVGDGTFARAAGDVTAFRISPELDAATLALAAALVRDMQLGRAAGGATDILSISLSATDYVGHAYGPGGQEMCLQLMSLDRDLGDFLAYIDSTGVDYAVALTADHGGLDIPERLVAKGVADAARVNPALAATAMGAAIGEKLGLKGPVLLGESAGDVYIDRSLSGADRARVLKEAIDLYSANPQVESVFSKEVIATKPMPSGDPSKWTEAERVRASFDPGRSGDLYVVLKPHIIPIAKPAPGYVATHGSLWDYDRRVPLLFWRRGMVSTTVEDPVEVEGLMPTLAAMIGLPLAPGSVDGSCLGQVSGVVCPTQR